MILEGRSVWLPFVRIPPMKSVSLSDPLSYYLWKAAPSWPNPGGGPDVCSASDLTQANLPLYLGGRLLQNRLQFCVWHCSHLLLWCCCNGAWRHQSGACTRGVVCADMYDDVVFAQGDCHPSPQSISVNVAFSVFCNHGPLDQEIPSLL